MGILAETHQLFCFKADHLQYWLKHTSCFVLRWTNGILAETRQLFCFKVDQWEYWLKHTSCFVLR